MGGVGHFCGRFGLLTWTTQVIFPWVMLLATAAVCTQFIRPAYSWPHIAPCCWKRKKPGQPFSFRSPDSRAQHPPSRMQRSGGILRVWHCPLGTPYLGFCPPGPPLRLHVTNGYELWTGDNCLDKLDGDFSENGPSLYENRVSKLREVLSHQTTTLTVHEATAAVQFQSLTFDLHKAPLDEAKKPLQDLVFGLVDRVQALEGAFKENPSIATPLPLNSPEKNTLRSQILIASGRSPPKSGTWQMSAKKRLPGESLINPGFKSKKTPTGVDFEDP